MKSKFTKRDFRKYAKHEAGHAVHYVLTFHEPFEYVWSQHSHDAVPDDGTGRGGKVVDGKVLGGAVVRTPGQQLVCTTFDLIQQYMAGVAGERIARKKPGKLDFYTILSGANGDFHAALEAIKESNEKGLSKWVITDNDKYMNDALAAAWRRLQAHKAAHAAVTRLLLERGRLSYEEVKNIVWDDVERMATSRSIVKMGIRAVEEELQNETFD